MFFILSKLFHFLTNPLVLVLALLLFSLFTKNTKRKKFTFWFGVGLLIFFSNDFIVNEVMTAWERPPTSYSEIKREYSWGIVLTGGMVNSNMPEDRVYFQYGADRVVNAVELYKKGVIKRVLISGGNGRLAEQERSEAGEFLKAMLLMGIPKADITIESESRNTHESAVNVKKMLAKEEEGSLLLITSAFHIRRSAACFRKLGVTVDTFSGDFYTHPRSFTPDVLFLPKAYAIEIWQKLFKEWLGMIAYRVAGYI